MHPRINTFHEHVIQHNAEQHIVKHAIPRQGKEGRDVGVPVFVRRLICRSRSEKVNPCVFELVIVIGY